MKSRFPRQEIELNSKVLPIALILSRPPALVICVLALPARHPHPSTRAGVKGAGGPAAPDKPSRILGAPPGHGPGRLPWWSKSESARRAGLGLIRVAHDAGPGPPRWGGASTPTDHVPRPKPFWPLGPAGTRNHHLTCRAIGAPAWAWGQCPAAVGANAPVLIKSYHHHPQAALTTQSRQPLS